MHAMLPARLLRLAGDDRLVAQVRAGSPVAFEVVYDRHHRGVLAFCRHMLGSVDEAEDAVQHTFMAAYRDLTASDRPVQLRPWLYVIARNRCLSVLRARREHPADELVEPSTEHLAAEVQRRQDLRDLLHDLSGLPEDQRAALVLAELGDVSHEEIAQVLGCAREKVKALVFQARTSLNASRAARETSCPEIREQLANLRGGSLRRNVLRRHLRECAGCRQFRDQVAAQRSALAVVLPVAPSVGLKEAVLGSVLGGGSAGAVAAGGGALAAKVLVAAAVAGGGAAGAEAVGDRTAPAAPAAAAGQPRERPPAAAPPVAVDHEEQSAPAAARPDTAVEPRLDAVERPGVKRRAPAGPDDDAGGPSESHAAGDEVPGAPASAPDGGDQAKSPEPSDAGGDEKADDEAKPRDDATPQPGGPPPHSRSDGRGSAPEHSNTGGRRTRPEHAGAGGQGSPPEQAGVRGPGSPPEQSNSGGEATPPEHATPVGAREPGPASGIEAPAGAAPPGRAKAGGGDGRSQHAPGVAEMVVG